MSKAKAKLKSWNKRTGNRNSRGTRVSGVKQNGAFDIRLHIQPTKDLISAAAESKSCGARSGLGIQQFIALLFKTNEELEKHRKMTDTEILRQLMEEFPDRNSVERLKTGQRRGGISSIRSDYNRGIYTKGVVPSPQSRRYNNEGEAVIDNRGRKRGTPNRSRQEIAKANRQKGAAKTNAKRAAKVKAAKAKAVANG